MSFPFHDRYKAPNYNVLRVSQRRDMPKNYKIVKQQISRIFLHGSPYSVACAFLSV